MKSDWSDYPFTAYELKPKGKKSFVFVRTSAECLCGKKANLKCIGFMCSNCCRSKINNCKVHAVK